MKSETLQASYRAAVKYVADAKRFQRATVLLAGFKLEYEIVLKFVFPDRRQRHNIG